MAINSIDRALDIINLLYSEGHELGISEIAQKLDVYKSTVHRTLSTLEEWNCQEKRTPKSLVKAVKLAPSAVIGMAGMG